MFNDNPLAVTSILMLLPLFPAAIIYFLLSPRSKYGRTKINEAKGAYEGQVLNFGKLKIEFSVFGSSATYLILLGAAYFIHDKIESEKIKRLAVQDQQAWLVEVDIGLTDHKGTPLIANNGEMQQIRVELEPSLTTASANRLQFWVIPNNGIFPTARFSLPLLSLEAEILDLNNRGKAQFDHSAKKILGIQPVWIKTGAAYGN